MLGYKGFCANTEWPELTKNDFVDTLKLPIQINGKLKGLVSIKKDEGEALVLKRAKSLSGVNKALTDKTIIKTVYIPGKILNIVIK